MSAVAALWRMDGRPVADDIGRMNSALRMYGPDGNGAWHEEGVGLGHCRMILVPEDRGDRQPIIGGGGSLVLSAAARIDNRADLIRELGVDPGRYAGLPDSRLVMAVLEKWGEEGIARLTGAFALVCWDTRRRRLICARDALGEYGLFYHHRDGLMAVASMVKGLHALPDVPRELNEQQVAAGLLLLPFRDATLFRDIKVLLPGHLLVADENGISVRQHWSPPAPNSIDFRDEREAVEAFQELFDEAVRSRLRSVGQIGSHLSAGLDSGSVTTVAARLLASEGKRLVAYTSAPREGYDLPGPRGRSGDETPGAKAVAALHANIDHVIVRPGEQTQLDGLDMGVLTGDQPVLNPCNTIWINEIDRQARQRGVKVMLTGQMGNMTISYNGRPYLSELLQRGRVIKWATEAWHQVRRPRGWRLVAHAFLPLLPRPLWLAYQKMVRPMDPLSYTALSSDAYNSLDVAAMAEDANWNLDYQPWLDGHAMRLAVMQRVDLAPLHAGQRAAFGVDQRDPTVDRRLVEFCLALPGRYFLNGGMEARLLRMAMRGQLPEMHLRLGGYKGYQSIDWHESLTRARSALAEELDRLEASPTASRLLDLPRLRRLVDDWPTGNWHSDRVTNSYRLALSRGIAMGHFIRKMEGGNQ